MSDLVGNPEDRFSRNEAHLKAKMQNNPLLRFQVFRPCINLSIELFCHDQVHILIVEVHLSPITRIHVFRFPTRQQANSFYFALPIHPEDNVSHVVGKPVFGVSSQVPHKPDCTATEDGWRLEISYLGRREIVLSV